MAGNNVNIVSHKSKLRSMELLLITIPAVNFKKQPKAGNSNKKEVTSRYKIC